MADLWAYHLLDVLKVFATNSPKICVEIVEYIKNC